jgi:hypothetical protein
VHKHPRRPIIDHRFSPWRNSLLTKQCLQQGHCQAQPIKARPWIFNLQGRTLNSSCVVAPHGIPLHQVTIAKPIPHHHPHTNQFCRSLDFGSHDILRQHHGTRTCPMILIASKASMSSLSNQTVREKIWVRTAESHPIQRSPGMNCQVEFANGAFWNTPLQPDQ